MKLAINYAAVTHTLSLPGLGLLLLLCSALSLSGCKSYGPIDAPDFDPTFSRTLEKSELLLFSNWTEFVDGTFMEAEEEPYSSYEGVMLLTNDRMMFALWNEDQQRYVPSIWTAYPFIAQVKMHNNILLQYIAIVATDGKKYTFMLGPKSVEKAYVVLMEQIKDNHNTLMPGS